MAFTLNEEGILVTETGEAVEIDGEALNLKSIIQPQLDHVAGKTRGEEKARYDKMANERIAELEEKLSGAPSPEEKVKLEATIKDLQNQDLTKDQIAEIAMLNAISDYPSPETLARAIEQAHGIGGNK